MSTELFEICRGFK